MRKVCQRRGHKWSSFPPLPFQFCDRWFCDGERVNPDYPMSEATGPSRQRSGKQPRTVGGTSSTTT